jgi:transcriptional regulator with XRE-family HTH domain
MTTPTATRPSRTEVIRGERRAELAAFLRSRRALITPDVAGLAPGLRRRTPGLRREEVAQLAGVGVTWYTWLEQGRPINVSPQVLDAVASVLRLDHSEHAHLYRLADMPEVPVKDGCAGLPPDIQVVLDGWVGQPACVYNGKYDLLAWNESYRALFPTICAPGADRNALWYCLTGNGSENPLGSPELLAHMVAIARSAYARHVGEPEWTEWIRRLSAHSLQFTAMWASNRVASPMPPTKEFNCFGLGTFHARTTSFGIPGAPDVRLIVYVPESEQDLALLAQLKDRLGE